MIKNLFESLKILYVEDDEFTREEISEFLEFEVDKIITAENGEEGLEKFKQHNIDIVITDINMPKMNGIDMAKKIKEINPNVPIIITSAYSDSEFIIKAIELGINKYVLKPIDMDELLVMIQNAAKELLFDYTIEIQNEYIDFLVKENPTFMLILNDKNIELMSKKFLEFLGYRDEKEFFEKNKNLTGTLNEILDNIKNNKEGTIITFEKDKQFLVQYKEFPKLNKQIFIFNTIDKTTEMKYLLKRMINKCPEFKEEIKKVLK